MDLLRKTRFIELFQSFLKTILPLLLIFFVFRVYEILFIVPRFLFVENKTIYEFLGLYYDLLTFIFLTIVFCPLYCILWWVNKKIATISNIIIICFLIIIYYSFLVNFEERSALYDREFFTRNLYDTWFTIKTVVDANYLLLLWEVLFLATYFISYYFILKIKSIKFWKKTVNYWIITCIIVIPVYILTKPKKENFSNPTYFSFSSNKLAYFVEDAFKYYNENKDSEKPDSEKPDFNSFKPYLNSNNFLTNDSTYPLLHNETTSNVLGNYFNLTNKQPNIIIIAVEGLSRSFSGPNASLESVTPFLDSLSQEGLYWDNCLSSSFGSFGILSSLLGALPYNKKGFTNMSKYPEYMSIIKILKENGYYSYYFSGADLGFDNFGPFMRSQGTDFILMNFDSIYSVMPASDGYSPGYPDDALFDQSIKIFKEKQKEPFIATYFTLTTHAPFIFKQKNRFDKKIEEKFRESKNKEFRTLDKGISKDLFAAFLFTDDCLRNYFNNLKTEPFFNNTIFIITGDHNHGVIPAKNTLCTYHVPLLIYSPMLKKHQRFHSINSHNNIPPTILSLLKNNGSLKNYLQKVHWIGNVLDTAVKFRNIHSLPLMIWGYNLHDFIYHNYYLDDNILYKIKPNLDLESETNKDSLIKIQTLLSSYRNIDKYVTSFNKLYPGNSELNNLNLVKEIKISYINKTDEYIDILNHFEVKNGNSVKYDITFNFDADSSIIDNWPIILLTIYDLKTNKMIYYGRKKISSLFTLNKKNWKTFIDEDEIQTGNNFSIGILNSAKIPVKISNLKIRLYEK